MTRRPSPTGILIDSGFDSHKSAGNKKAHKIMGLCAISGGDAGIRTLDSVFDRMLP